MSLKVDSRKVKKGDTFIAIRGLTEDGHKYIEDAIKNGATKIICEEGNYSVETLIVENTKDYLDKEIKKLFDETLEDMILIGVTGTNGKTTTTFFIYELFNLLGIKSAVLGTIGFYVDKEIIPTSNTTPGQIELYELFFEAKKRGCKAVVMELSSHSLYHDRIKGLSFDAAAFTNLTQDHLDFHKTMKEYKNTKLKILNYLKKDAFIVVNNDDKYSKDFIKENSITLGKKDSNLIINEINLFKDSSNVKFNYENKSYEINLNFNADFNVYNFLTALMIVNKFGFDVDNILKVSDKLYYPEGRNEKIDVFGAEVIIDYAHSPDAVNKMIDTYRPLTRGKLITLTGCDGSRDRGKRPKMARIAGEKSDFAILTHTHPFDEDPDHVKKDVLKGATKNSIFIDDRKEAIRKGLNMLEKGDTLLLLGMGRETYQTYGKEIRPHSDYEEVMKFIKDKNKYPPA